MGDLEASLGVLFPFEGGIAQWMQCEVSLLSSAMLWEFSAVSSAFSQTAVPLPRALQHYCRCSFPCSKAHFPCSSVPQISFFSGACVPHAPPRPSLGTCCMCCGCITSLQHHPCPAEESSPLFPSLLLFTSTGIQHWLARRRQLHQHSP